MKTLNTNLILLFILFLWSQIAFGGTSGCGVGTNIWKGDKGVSAHTSANSTNQTFSRPFSVSSGTSGCDGAETQSVKNEREIRKFLAFNYDHVSEEMSQGQGEYLNTYANLLGCSSHSQNHFNRVTQSSYPIIFSDSNSPKSILNKTLQMIDNDTILKSNCYHF